MGRGAISVLMLVAACGSSPTRVGSAPSWRDAPHLTTTAAEPVVFAPGTPDTGMYNSGLRLAKSTPLSDAVVKAVRDAAKVAGIEAPFADARLFRACSELAQVVPEQGVVAYRVVEFAMQRNGLIEPSPHLLVVWGDLGDPALIVAQLEPHFANMLASGANARVGIGVARRGGDGTGAVVFALQASAVSTNPIPRSLPSDGTFRLQGSVTPSYRNPEVLVTFDTGETRRITPTPGSKGSGFGAELSCVGRRGKQQIEINATHETGATVLANFPIWCGESAPTAIDVAAQGSDPAPTSAVEAEQRLLALVNRDRRKAGLVGLEWDDAVAAVARSHSKEMRRTQVVAHLSPTTGSAADRVRAARLKSPLVLENVARAYGVAEAHLGLMDSPGHRQNLMSPLATHIGIGVVLGELISGRPEMFVTQVFTRVNRPIDERQAADTLHGILAGKRSMPRAASLERISQQVADGLASGRPRQRAWDSVAAELKQLGKTYKKVGSVITAVADLSSVEASALLTGVVDEIGIGIAQGPHPELGDDAIWIVLLLGELPRPSK
jgi:uncharacterized protein YkwD